MKKNKMLIYSYSITGHHYEYLNHIYKKAINTIDTEFVFILPLGLKDIIKKLDWPNSENVIIVLEDFSKLNNKKPIGRSIKLAIKIKKAIKKYNIDHVFLISLMAFLPLLPFIISNKTKITGILYKIYLYNWKQADYTQRIVDIFKYIILTKLAVFEKIFILNDTASANYLNRKYRTSKFEFLPDPFVPIPIANCYDIRTKFGIAVNKKVFLHFGGLTERKGTLEILKAIQLMSIEELQDLCFIFAGKIYIDIKTDFYQIYDTVKNRTQILIFDEFCDFAFLGSLCISSNFLLMPYKETAQSSGILGYAAQFNKPVIAPNQKLLGKLVKRNKLGYLIENSNAKSIANFLKNSEKNRYKINSERYVLENSVENFTNTIFSNINS